jgi:amino acid transporter
MEDKQALSVSEAWGYKQELPRVVRWVQSFAVGFSQISITAGIFGTLGVVLVTSGAIGIWTWGITTIGFLLVAAVYSAFAARVPLTGHGYQYVSRYAPPEIGWFVGWLTLLLTGIASMSVAYSVATFVLPPLFGFTATTLTSILLTVFIVAIYGAMTMFSTKATARINEAAVYTELIGMLGFGLLLFIVVAARGGLHWGYLFSKGPAAHVHGFFSLLPLAGRSNSPWVGAFVMALFTLFGFESCANVGEEMRGDARVEIPRAIFLAELVAGVAGMIFLILTIASAGNLGAVTKSASPLSFIMTEQLGTVLGKIFLVVVLFSVFAAGLVLFLSTVRLVWAMSRDQRFPGWRAWRIINPRFRTPLLAAVMVWVALEAIFAAFVQQTHVWNDLIGATSLPPFVIYPTVMIVYLVQRRKLPPAKVFRLGKAEIPIVVLGLVWIVFGLSVFKASAFDSAWAYTGGGILLGLIYLGWLRIRGKPLGLARAPGAEGEQAAGAEMPVT